jgi:hypothetical protein
MYPDENTPTRLFNGIPFRDIPICDVKASKNNTIICVSNAQGGFLLCMPVSIVCCSSETPKYIELFPHCYYFKALD